MSINVERDVDMSITGQRHAFYFTYSAGCSKDGMLKYFDAHLYKYELFRRRCSFAITTYS